MGKKSPAKILRSTKRMTYFLRKKLINVSKCLQNSTNEETPTFPPKKVDYLTKEHFLLIIKDFDKQRQKEREIEKVEREKERKEDFVKFELERKKNLDKLKIKLSLPP